MYHIMTDRSIFYEENVVLETELNRGWFIRERTSVCFTKFVTG